MDLLPFNGGCRTDFVEDKNGKKFYTFQCSCTSNGSDVNNLIFSLENQTLEMKNIIVNECELIYVCKICRQVYCSLEHFISHKIQCIINRNQSNANALHLSEEIRKEFDELKEITAKREEANRKEEYEMTKETENEVPNTKPKTNEPPKRTRGRPKKVKTMGDAQTKQQQKTQAQKLVHKSKFHALRRRIPKPIANVNKSIPVIKKNKPGPKVNGETKRPIGRPKLSNSYIVKLGQDALKLVDLKTLTCLECSKQLRDKHYLMKHVAVSHLGLQRFKCKFCNFKSNSLPDCRSHLQDAHKKTADLDKMLIHLFCQLQE